MAQTNVYRQFWKATSNVAEDRRLVGVFNIVADGASWTLGSFVRPSAGSTATAGQGNMFTVTQSATVGGASTANTPFFVATTEKIYQACATFAQVNLFPTNGTTAATAPVVAQATFAQAQASRYDSTTGGFWITLLDYKGDPLGATQVPPTGYTWRISFEVVIKPTVTPVSL